MYIYIYKHTHIYIYTYIYIYKHTYTYIYMCIYQTDKEQSVVNATKRWSDKAVSSHKSVVWEKMWTQTTLMRVPLNYN